MGYINIVSKEEKGRREKDGGREHNQSRKVARLAISDMGIIKLISCHLIPSMLVVDI